MTIHSPLQTLDVTGLPDAFVRSLQVQIDQVKSNLKEPVAADGETPAEPRHIVHHDHTPEEFERLLDELAAMSSGQILRPDFSRADLYDDHD